jgi:hypothetical protein
MDDVVSVGELSCEQSNGSRVDQINILDIHMYREEASFQRPEDG